MGMMEKKMETTIVYWGYIGIMGKNMETTIMGYIGVRGSLGGLKGSYFQAERGVGKGPFERVRLNPVLNPEPQSLPSLSQAKLSLRVMDSMLE